MSDIYSGVNIVQSKTNNQGTISLAMYWSTIKFSLWLIGHIAMLHVMRPCYIIRKTVWLTGKIITFTH